MNALPGKWVGTIKRFHFYSSLCRPLGRADQVILVDSTHGPASVVCVRFYVDVVVYTAQKSFKRNLVWNDRQKKKKKRRKNAHIMKSFPPCCRGRRHENNLWLRKKKKKNYSNRTKKTTCPRRAEFRTIFE